MTEWLNWLISIHFSSLIPKMLMFTLSISCLTMSNLLWFTDLTFQVPMQYCSLQHQTTFTTTHIQNWVLFLLWPSYFILLGAVNNCLLLFPSSNKSTDGLGGGDKCWQPKLVRCGHFPWMRSREEAPSVTSQQSIHHAELGGCAMSHGSDATHSCFSDQVLVDFVE